MSEMQKVTDDVEVLTVTSPSATAGNGKLSVRFCDLPAEIRLRIWEMIWPESRVIELCTPFDFNPYNVFLRFEPRSSWLFPTCYLAEWLQAGMYFTIPEVHPNAEEDNRITRVWGESQKQLIRRGRNLKRKYPALGAPPITLAICQESREHTLSNFRAITITRCFQPTRIFWMRPEEDAFVFTPIHDHPSNVFLREVFARDYGQQLVHVRRVVVYLQDWRQAKLDILQIFDDIRVIQLVLHQGITVQDVDLREEAGRHEWRCLFELVDDTTRIHGRYNAAQLGSEKKA